MYLCNIHVCTHHTAYCQFLNLGILLTPLLSERILYCNIQPYPEDDPAVVETVDQKCHVETDKEKGIDSKPYQLQRKQQVITHLKLGEFSTAEIKYLNINTVK